VPEQEMIMNPKNRVVNKRISTLIIAIPPNFDFNHGDEKLIVS
jgi:hypothetical protein